VLSLGASCVIHTARSVALASARHQLARAVALSWCAQEALGRRGSSTSDGGASGMPTTAAGSAPVAPQQQAGSNPLPASPLGRASIASAAGGGRGSAAGTPRVSASSSSDRRLATHVQNSQQPGAQVQGAGSVAAAAGGSVAAGQQQQRLRHEGSLTAAQQRASVTGGRAAAGSCGGSSSVLERLRQLPGNRACADCGCVLRVGCAARHALTLRRARAAGTRAAAVLPPCVRVGAKNTAAPPPPPAVLPTRTGPH
jgi:hypothetical protein